MKVVIRYEIEKVTFNLNDAEAKKMGYCLNVDIELYTDEKDLELEDRIEVVLNAHELFWNKSEVWIETEKLYEVLYQMTI